MGPKAETKPSAPEQIFPSKVRLPGFNLRIKNSLNDYTLLEIDVCRKDMI